MREYLFRGKRKDNGEWVEGCLWVFDDYADISYRDQEYSEIVNTVEVIPETVGQYKDGFCNYGDRREENAVD